MKVTVTVLANLEVDPSDYLEEDEVLEGTEDAEHAEEEDLEVVAASEIVDRVSNQIDEGTLSMDDVIEQASDYTVTAKPYTDEPVDWTTYVLPSEVAFVKSIVDQVPEAFGARDRFYEILQRLAGAQ